MPFKYFIFQFHSIPPCSYVKAEGKEICAYCVCNTSKVWDPTLSPFSSSSFRPETFQNTKKFSYRVLDLFSLLLGSTTPLLQCQQCKAGCFPLFLWLKNYLFTTKVTIFSQVQFIPVSTSSYWVMSMHKIFHLSYNIAVGYDCLVVVIKLNSVVHVVDPT